MKRIFLGVAVIASLAVHAQTGAGSSYLKAADKYYQKGDYYSAAKYYEKYLGLEKSVKADEFDPYSIRALQKSSRSAGSDRQQAIYNLAESYRNLHYYVKAAPVYEMTLTFDRSRYPLNQYHYALTLRSLGKYSDAEKSLQSFLDGYVSQDQYAVDAKRELQNLRFIQEQLNRKDLAQYTVTGVDVMGKDGANYAPVWMDDNSLLFTSTRLKEKESRRLNRIYNAQYANNALSAVKAVSVPSAASTHQGVLAIAPSGDLLYITRWTIMDGKNTSAIYRSRLQNAKWSEPEKLGDEINVPGSSNQQPYVMPGGKQLVFASNRSGGQGGFDLWIAQLDADGNATNPENMGTVINTGGDEQAPYFHTTSSTLVFASNGRVGMGGFDLFSSRQKAGNWAEPINLGHPVNSIKDDIYFASKGGAKNMLERVLLSSDRSSDCCLDLFYLSRILPDISIEGTIVGCEGNLPLPGATVTIVEKGTGKNISTVTTDAAGKYRFSVKEFQPMQAVAKMDGYVETSMTINEPENNEMLVLYNQSLCMNSVPPPVNVAIVIPNIYYDFNKTELTSTSYPALDSLVSLMNRFPDMTVEIGAHTDDFGSAEHNQYISDKRAANIVAYLHKKGIDKTRMVAKGYSFTMPVEPNKNDDGTDNPAGREKNRRTEMKVLHY